MIEEWDEAPIERVMRIAEADDLDTAIQALVEDNTRLKAELILTESKLDYLIGKVKGTKEDLDE